MSQQKLWGGRFSKKTNAMVEDFTHSMQFDQKLAKYDCLGSLYHVDVLKKAQLINDICIALSQRYDGEGAGVEAAKLKALRYVFGKTVLDDIKKLPVAVIEAGLAAIQSRTDGNEDE